MLPFDNRPWAKALARTVIFLSIVAAAFGAYYCSVTNQLHISEITIIGLSLLTIIPPNVAIILRKSGSRETATPVSQAHLRAR